MDTPLLNLLVDETLLRGEVARVVLLNLQILGLVIQVILPVIVWVLSVAAIVLQRPVSWHSGVEQAASSTIRATVLLSLKTKI